MATTEAKTQPARLLSLDVMRGGTILAMILVNNAGDWGNIYWPLGHADWHGWTPTDLIFPFFLFMVGVAMAYSFAKYTGDAGRPTAAVWGRVLRRTAALILLGLFLNASGRLLSVPLGYQDSWNWDTLRWPGVLQRIGLAYLGASAVVLLLGKRGVLVAGVVLLAAYALMLKTLPTDVAPAERLGQVGNAARVVDLALMGKDHLYTRATSRPTDPEGLLSTLPSIVSVLLGYGMGRRLKAEPLTAGLAAKFLVGGLAIAAAGQGWGGLPHPGAGMPINKALWTPSFVLLAGGLGMAVLACCLFVFDLSGKDSPALRRLATAFQMVGVNAILAFVASGFVARSLTVFRLGDTTVKGWLYQNVFVEPLAAAGLGDQRLASVSYATTYVLLWWLILWYFWRRKWTLRV